MTLAEHQITKPNGHGGVIANMRWPSRETLNKLARSPTISLPLGRKRIQLATDRVRAAPAVTPTLSGAIGMTAIGLGVAGLFFPRQVARALGVNAPAAVIQSVFGLRELWSGYSLVGDPTRSDVLWARVGGDAFDIVALSALDRRSNPRRGTARAALGFVLAVTALDVFTAVRMSTVQRNCV